MNAENERWFPAKIQLRYTDIDAQGHANNVSVVELMQQARTQILESGSAQQSLLGSGVVVTSHEVNYTAPIRYSAEYLDILVGVSKLGGAKFEMAYQIFQDGKLCVTAKTSLCPFDFESQYPRRLKPEERDFFEQWRVSAPSLEPLPRPAIGAAGHVTIAQPRWSDIDGYGHVNNVVQLNYLMLGRIDATVSADPSTARAGIEVGDEGQRRLSWVIVRQDVQYVRQVSYRAEPYEVCTAVTRVGSKSLTLAAELRREGDPEPFTTGQVVLVAVDPETGSAVELPQSTRQAMNCLLVNL